MDTPNERPKPLRAEDSGTNPQPDDQCSSSDADASDPRSPHQENEAANDEASSSHLQRGNDSSTGRADQSPFRDDAGPTQPDQTENGEAPAASGQDGTDAPTPQQNDLTPTPVASANVSTDGQSDINPNVSAAPRSNTTAGSDDGPMGSNLSSQHLHDRDKTLGTEAAELERLRTGVESRLANVRALCELAVQYRQIDRRYRQLDQRQTTLDHLDAKLAIRQQEVDSKIAQLKQQRTGHGDQRGQLESRYGKLDQEQSRLDAERHELSVQRETLRQQQQELVFQKQELQEHSVRLGQLRDQLDSERSQLEAEHQETTGLVRKAARDRQEAVGDQDKLTRQGHELSVQREALRQQQQALAFQKQELQERSEQLQQLRHQLDSERSQLEAQRQEITGFVREAARDRQEAVRRQAESDLQRQELECQLQEQELEYHRQELDQVWRNIQQNHDAVEKEKATLAKRHRAFDDKPAQVDAQRIELCQQNALTTLPNPVITSSISARLSEGSGESVYQLGASKMEQVSVAEQPNQLSKSIDVAVKFVGDFAIIPGASQIMNGKLASGLGHAVAGLVLRRVGGLAFGPIGWAAVAANAFTKSVSNRNIWSHVVGAKDTVADTHKQHRHEVLLAELKAARTKDEADRSDYEKELLAVVSEPEPTHQKEQSPLRDQR